jgi:hypothetical protein
LHRQMLLRLQCRAMPLMASPSFGMTSPRLAVHLTRVWPPASRGASRASSRMLE